MHSVVDLQCLTNEISFELIVHIVLYEDQNSIMTFYVIFLSSCVISPLNAGNIISSK